MNLELIEPHIKIEVEKLGYELFELNWIKVAGEDVLQVVIDHQDGIDIDDCVSVNDVVSPLLDTLILDDETYMLEVCSPGLERKIRTLDEINGAVGSYVFIKFKQNGEKLSLEGNILSVDENGVVALEYMAKNVKKTIHVAYDDIRFARYAVKF